MLLKRIERMIHKESKPIMNTATEKKQIKWKSAEALLLRQMLLMLTLHDINKYDEIDVGVIS